MKEVVNCSYCDVLLMYVILVVICVFTPVLDNLSQFVQADCWML